METTIIIKDTQKEIIVPFDIEAMVEFFLKDISVKSLARSMRRLNHKALFAMLTNPGMNVFDTYDIDWINEFAEVLDPYLNED